MPTTRRLLVLACACAAAVLGSCGGGQDAHDAADAATARRQVSSSQAADHAVDAAELFRWAEFTWPELFPDSAPLVQVPYQGRNYLVRTYVNGNHLGVSDGHVYGLGSFTGGVLQDFGPVAGFTSQVCAVTGCGALESGGVHDAVRVLPPDRRSIVDTGFIGGSIDQPYFFGRLTGDVAGLVGRPIYLVVEDPSRLFEPTGQVRVYGDWGYDVRLTPGPLRRLGRFTGTLKLFACLDPRCQTRLGGTPIAIPYDVKVVQALVASTERVEVTVPFGSVPELVDITMSVAPDVQFWGWVNAGIDGDLSNGHGGAASGVSAGYYYSEPFYNGMSGTVGGFKLKFGNSLPGTYRGTAFAEIRVTANGGRSFGVARKSIEIIYTVTPSTVPAAFSPPRVEVVEGKSINMDPDRVASRAFHQATLLSTLPMNWRFVGVERLRAPPEETDPWLLEHWVDAESDHYGIGTLRLTVYTRRARVVVNATTGATEARYLKPGIYEAQVRIRGTPISGDAAPVDVLLPVRQEMR